MPSKFFDGTITKPSIGGGWFANVLEMPMRYRYGRYSLRVESQWKVKRAFPRWTGSSWLSQSPDLGVLKSTYWGNSRWKHGTNSRYRIDGVTRDVYGTPVPGCTVLCLGQVAGDIVYTTLSDTLGAYTVYTPYYGAANIVVSYKATPDTAGATINVQGI